MIWHVTVSKEGEALDFCEADAEGAVALPENVVDPDAFMASHMLVDGAWQRKPVVEHEPTPEEIEAAKEADYQDRLAAREAAIDAAITASAAYRSFIRGGMTLTAYRDAASDIAAQFPMPERTL